MKRARVIACDWRDLITFIYLGDTFPFPSERAIKNMVWLIYFVGQDIHLTRKTWIC